MLTQLQGAVERFIDDMYASYEASGSGSSSGSDPTGGDDTNDNNTAWSNYTSWSNYTISSNYTGGSNSTSSSNNSDHNTYGSDTDDDMTIVLDSNYTEFDECMDGEMVTCVDDVLTLEQFDSDSCSGTAINTTTWSHDTCYLEAVSVGCSSACKCCAMYVLGSHACLGGSFHLLVRYSNTCRVFFFLAFYRM